MFFVNTGKLEIKMRYDINCFLLKKDAAINVTTAILNQMNVTLDYAAINETATHITVCYLNIYDID